MRASHIPNVEEHTLEVARVVKLQEASCSVRLGTSSLNVDIEGIGCEQYQCGTSVHYSCPCLQNLCLFVSIAWLRHRELIRFDMKMG